MKNSVSKMPQKLVSKNIMKVGAISDMSEDNIIVDENGNSILRYAITFIHKMTGESIRADGFNEKEGVVFKAIGKGEVTEYVKLGDIKNLIEFINPNAENYVPTKEKILALTKYINGKVKVEENTAESFNTYNLFLSKIRSYTMKNYPDTDEKKLDAFLDTMKIEKPEPEIIEKAEVVEEAIEENVEYVIDRALDEGISLSVDDAELDMFAEMDEDFQVPDTYIPEDNNIPSKGSDTVLVNNSKVASKSITTSDKSTVNTSDNVAKTVYKKPDGNFELKQAVIDNAINTIKEDPKYTDFEFDGHVSYMSSKNDKGFVNMFMKFNYDEEHNLVYMPKFKKIYKNLKTNDGDFLVSKMGYTGPIVWIEVS